MKCLCLLLLLFLILVLALDASAAEASDARATVDALVSDQESNEMLGGSLVLDLGLGRGFRARTEGLLGDLEGTTFKEMGLGLHRRFEHCMAAAFYDHQRLDVFRSHLLSAEMHRTPESDLTLVMLAGWESRSHDNDRAFGGLFVRTYPTENLMIQTGLGSQGTLQGRFEPDMIELVGSVEFRVPPLSTWGVSVFAEQRLEEEFRVGIRTTVRPERTLVQQHRHGGFFRSRL